MFLHRVIVPLKVRHFYSFEFIKYLFKLIKNDSFLDIRFDLPQKQKQKFEFYFNIENLDFLAHLLDIVNKEFIYYKDKYQNLGRF